MVEVVKTEPGLQIDSGRHETGDKFDVDKRVARGLKFKKLLESDGHHRTLHASFSCFAYVMGLTCHPEAYIRLYQVNLRYATGTLLKKFFLTGNLVLRAL